MTTTRGAARAAPVATLIVFLVACGGDDDGSVDSSTGERSPVEPPAFVADIGDAIAAVEAELGVGQSFFEVTANDQFTNVFVAVDDGTTAVPYLFVDGELQPPAPAQPGAEGRTFAAGDVGFDPTMILSGVAADLPETSVDALSVYGDGVGAVYVLGVTSSAGGELDIVVTSDGVIVSVDPL